MRPKKAIALLATACLILVLGAQRTRLRRWIQRILTSMDVFTIALSKYSDFASRLSTDLQAWYSGTSSTSSNAAIAKLRSLLGDVKLQKYIGQIIAQSLDSWREKTHANENVIVPPLADGLFHVPASSSGAAADDAAAADSTMAIISRALDVLSSSSGRSFVSVVTRSFSRELVAALLVMNGSVRSIKDPPAKQNAAVLDGSFDSVVAAARGFESFICSPTSLAQTPSATPRTAVVSMSNSHFGVVAAAAEAMMSSSTGAAACLSEAPPPPPPPPAATAASPRFSDSTFGHLLHTPCNEHHRVETEFDCQHRHHHDDHHHQQQQHVQHQHMQQLHAQQEEQQLDHDKLSSDHVHCLSHEQDSPPSLPPMVTALIPIISSSNGLQVVRTIVHEVVDTAMPHLVPTGGSGGDAVTPEQIMELLSRREHRSLVCDVFESASRGAAAAFISSQVQSPAGDVAHNKLQQQSVDAARGRQTSAMLFMCAIACVYEVTCRHWKLAAAGGIALVACFAVPIIAMLRLLGHDFHFELH